MMDWILVFGFGGLAVGVAGLLYCIFLTWRG